MPLEFGESTILPCLIASYAQSTENGLQELQYQLIFIAWTSISVYYHAHFYSTIVLALLFNVHFFALVHSLPVSNAYLTYYIPRFFIWTLLYLYACLLSSSDINTSDISHLINVKLLLNQQKIIKSILDPQLFMPFKSFAKIYEHKSNDHHTFILKCLQILCGSDFYGCVFTQDYSIISALCFYCKSTQSLVF